MALSSYQIAQNEISEKFAKLQAQEEKLALDSKEFYDRTTAPGYAPSEQQKEIDRQTAQKLDQELQRINLGYQRADVDQSAETTRLNTHQSNYSQAKQKLIDKFQRRESAIDGDIRQALQNPAIGVLGVIAFMLGAINKVVGYTARTYIDKQLYPEKHKSQKKAENADVKRHYLNARRRATGTGTDANAARAAQRRREHQQRAEERRRLRRARRDQRRAMRAGRRPRAPGATFRPQQGMGGPAPG